MQGVYDDLKAVLDAYDWELNCRIEVGSGSRYIHPKIFRDTEVVGTNVPDNSIIIQLTIARWIERAGSAVALRARVDTSFLCVSRTPEVASKLVDQVMTVMFGAPKSYISTAFNTVHKGIPSQSYTTTIVKQPNGYFQQSFVMQIETDQAN